MLEWLGHPALGNITLILAVLAAVWYAWETHKLRHQMIRPKIVFFLRAQEAPDSLGLEEEFGQSVELVMKNVGDGAAINVSIGLIRPPDGHLRPHPQAVPLLEKGQEVILALYADGRTEPNLGSMMNEPSIRLELKATYYDIENRRLTTSSWIGGGASAPFITDR